MKNDGFKHWRALRFREMTNLNEVMITLSDSRRLQIFDLLREEASVRPFSGGGDGREQASQRHHDHLPRLEENGIVEWNWNTGPGRTGDDAEMFEPVLTVLDDRCDALPDDFLKTGRQTC